MYVVEKYRLEVTLGIFHSNTIKVVPMSKLDRVVHGHIQLCFKYKKQWIHMCVSEFWQDFMLRSPASEQNQLLKFSQLLLYYQKFLLAPLPSSLFHAIFLIKI